MVLLIYILRYIRLCDIRPDVRSPRPAWTCSPRHLASGRLVASISVAHLLFPRSITGPNRAPRSFPSMLRGWQSPHNDVTTPAGGSRTAGRLHGDRIDTGGLEHTVDHLHDLMIPYHFGWCQVN